MTPVGDQFQLAPRNLASMLLLRPKQAFSHQNSRPKFSLEVTRQAPQRKNSLCLFPHQNDLMVILVGDEVSFRLRASNREFSTH